MPFPRAFWHRDGSWQGWKTHHIRRCLHAATWAGRPGASYVLSPPLPPRPERGSAASSPTSERLLTAPTPLPVGGVWPPPDLLQPGLQPQASWASPGLSPAELFLLPPQCLGLSEQGWGPGSAGPNVDPICTTHALPSLGQAARLLIASGSPPRKNGVVMEIKEA